MFEHVALLSIPLFTMIENNRNAHNYACPSFLLVRRECVSFREASVA